jgi:hypothetical protein
VRDTFLNYFRAKARSARRGCALARRAAPGQFVASLQALEPSRTPG